MTAREDDRNMARAFLDILNPNKNGLRSSEALRGLSWREYVGIEPTADL
ncbi:hypothetical protein TPY_2637 [Sulfobacillus acidophilus TPY]|nr:hypothetical protein TPY_2637 [Sulfobacillus acidophilus TPY]